MDGDGATLGAGGALTLSSADFEVRRLFTTPMLSAMVNEAAVINASLRTIILLKAYECEGVALSNAGGWQSAGDFLDWSGDMGRQLIDTAVRLAGGFTGLQSESGLAMGGPDWRINAWANVNRPGDANHRHHHPGAFWSGVYWVDAGDEDQGGELELCDPRGVLPAFYAPQLRYAIPGCLSAGGSDFLNPRTGQMILFPAWLEHAVRPYRGTRPRISVAFNLSV